MDKNDKTKINLESSNKNNIKNENPGEINNSQFLVNLYFKRFVLESDH